MPSIILNTRIHAPATICFDLSRSVVLHQQSVSHTQEYVTKGRTEGLFELGEEVTWRAKHFGVWQSLTVRITAMEPPYYFCDEMLKGAFKRFKHEHFFQQEGDFTQMKDCFNFESPLGIIGECFNALVLTRYMTHLLEVRNQTIKEAAESGEWRTVLNK